MLVHVIGRPYRRQHFFRDRLYLTQLSGAFDDYRKLVATQTRDHIGLAYTLL